MSEREPNLPDEQEVDLTGVLDQGDYPPLLNAAVPLTILIVSVAYAWSLRDIVNPTMNLLFLKPIFVVIWGLLVVVVIRDVVPSIQRHREWRRLSAARGMSWQEHLAPGTEGGAGLIVAATFIFAVFGPGHGPVTYLISAFLYLAVTGYLIGDRQVIRLLVQSALLAGGLYLLMGVALGVRL